MLHALMETFSHRGSWCTHSLKLMAYWTNSSEITPVMNTTHAENRVNAYNHR